MEGILRINLCKNGSITVFYKDILYIEKMIHSNEWIDINAKSREAIEGNFFLWMTNGSDTPFDCEFDWEYDINIVEYNNNVVAFWPSGNVTQRMILDTIILSVKSYNKEYKCNISLDIRKPHHGFSSMPALAV